MTPGGFVARRAVIYCRVSTDDQNCDRQISDLKTFAARADYELLGIFTETASGAKCDRTERKKILAIARKLDLKKSHDTIELRGMPDAATLLNQLKGRRKKSKADLADVEAILEMLEPTD